MRLRWILPFTTLLLLAILAASFFTHNADGQLDGDVAQQVGHAPRHWWAGELVRLVTSIPFTADRWHLAAALVMTTLCVGSCERLRGPLVTAGLFLASHCATLAALAVCLYLGHALIATHASRQLLNISDVGPSAGYYGCLGTVLFEIKRKPVVIFSYLIVAYLSLRVVASSIGPTYYPHLFQTDLAHLIAFLLGGFVLRKAVSIHKD